MKYSKNSIMYYVTDRMPPWVVVRKETIDKMAKRNGE